MTEALTLKGGCHCGAVRFRAEVNALEAIDCNCSICSKSGFLHVIVEKERFSLIRGEDMLTSYRFNTGIAEHLFCRVCGVKSFYRPRSHPNAYSINLRCLEDKDLSGCFRIRSFDGRNWEDRIGDLHATDTLKESL